MKPTHGFKNLLIGFGERLGWWGERGRGWARGGLAGGGGLKEVMEQSPYQSRQTAPLLSNEQEGLVNKFASTACNGDASDSGRNLRLAVTAAGMQLCIIRRKSQCVASTSPSPFLPPKKRKINIVQYRCLSYFSLLLGGHGGCVSNWLCVPRNTATLRQFIYLRFVSNHKKRCNQHKTKLKCYLVWKCGQRHTHTHTFKI